jgi:hypothetical protein
MTDSTEDDMPTTDTTPTLLIQQDTRDRDASCPLCGEFAGAPVAFAITDTDGSALCETCVDKHFTPGHWELLEGIDQIDTALFKAAPQDRPGMVAFALELIGHLVAANNQISAQLAAEKPEQ